MTDFVHLHVHTEYSLLDGAAKVEDLVEHMARNGIDACAVTDHGNMYASLYFAEECAKKGIKYIIGCELYMTDDRHVRSPEHRTEHLIVLAKNKVGYKNIVYLDSMAYIDGMYCGKPRMDYRTLKEHSEGVICLSACLAGRIPRLLLAGDYEGAKAFALDMKDTFGEDFYIELQDHGLPEEKQVLPLLIRLAHETGIQTVATNDVHYILKEDWEVQDLLLCIQTKKTVDDPKRMRFGSQEFYFKSGDEMAELFSYIPEAVRNTRVIADKVTEAVFDLNPNKGYIPKYDTELIPNYTPDDGSTSPEYLTRLTWEGLPRRYETVTDEIRKRAEYELGVIIGMKYADYFLIVWDYINWSRRQGIPVGPGRGSGVGSIVAYAVGITDVDPLKYDLIFERFLNPDRQSMPDFDVDFCTKRRHETIEYVRQKYSPEKVAQIVTFGTLASRAVIKDVGKAMRIPFSETNRVTKVMDGKSTIAELLGRNLPKLEEKLKDLSLPEEKRADLQKTYEEQLAKKNREFIEIYEGSPELRKVIDFGQKLEGMPKNTSEHAAGVIICQKVLAENVPLARNGEDIVTQFDMKEAESIGLLKMDFLALTTLTDIQNTLDYIREDYGVEIDFHKIGYDTPEAYQLISSGDTDAVFQLEQGGMKKFMRELQPERLEDLIAGISLYRPGPMDFIPIYIKNKNDPSGIVYDTPLMEPILKNSYGVIIYQEQVMQIFQSLAGYPFGQADLVRRAMSKKNKKELMDHKEKFIRGGSYKDPKTGEEKPIPGCGSNGIPEEVAAKIFADMESFASYAFNKSHATAYAVVAYQTAYLKYFYPKQFLAGVLNDRLDKIEEITKYVVYMKEKGIPVYPPDLNRSRVEFRVEGEGLRFGLSALRGVGSDAISKVIDERDGNGPFRSFEDFLMRCTKHVNKKMVEGLIDSGACDCFGRHRSQYRAVYEGAMGRIADMDRQKETAQISLFGTIVKEPDLVLDYPDIPEFGDEERLANEKAVLGVYVSGHPFEGYVSAFRDCNFSCRLLMDREEDEDGTVSYNSIKHEQKVSMGGIVTRIKKTSTKNGQPMAYVTVEDLYGSIECVAFPKVYDRIRGFLRTDIIVSLSGKIDIQDGKDPSILLDAMQEFDTESVKRAREPAEETHALKQAAVRREAAPEPQREPSKLWLDARGMDEGEFEELADMLAAYSGPIEVWIAYGGKKYRYSKGIVRTKAFEAELSTFLPPKCIKYM